MPFDARALVLGLALSVAVSSPGIAAGGSSTTYDMVIEHGLIIDGTGSKPYAGDVGVINGRIAAIGDLSSAVATRRIDANGLVVAPGFINIHDHSEIDALPTAVNMLTQGVTTAILNPDGWSDLDLQKQLKDSGRKGLALNIGGYIGFNAVWESVMGQEDHRPTPAQIAAMRDLITHGLEAGAFGVSSGLDYKPAYYARAEEVTAVVSAARDWRTNFPNHDRLAPETGWSSRVGVAETIAIAGDAGLSPEITHIKSQGHEQGGAPTIVAMMRAATAKGHYTPGDVYPYLAGMTGLWSLSVPGWAQAGGPEAMAKRFKDPTLRSKILVETEAALKARFGGASGVYLVESRRELADVAKAQDVSDAEALLRVIEGGESYGIFRFGAEQDLRTFLQAPEIAVSCDCGATTEVRNHPRAFGTFPRVLGHYTRDEHLLSLTEAVRKMTGLPASIVGLVDRGFLAPGMAADITVFDPTTIADHSTFEKPTLVSDGVRDVLVNGRLELLDGKPTGEKAGVALARDEHMPTRPMHVAGNARLRLENLHLNGPNGEPAVLTFEAQQTLDGRAVGRLRLIDATKGASIETSSLGMLQVADHWAALTGAEGRTAFSLIIDAGDPRTPGKTIIRLTLGDSAVYVARIDSSTLRLASGGRAPN